MTYRAILAASAALALCLAGTAASAQTADKSIALSNNYAGNSWRQAMINSWEEVTGKAVADGIVGSADAFTTAENSATAGTPSPPIQASQSQTRSCSPHESRLSSSTAGMLMNLLVWSANAEAIRLVSIF